MIRPITPADTPALVEIAQGTGVFKPGELVALREVLDDFHAAEAVQGHRAVADERDGHLVAFAYYAPAAMTDRTWYVYWIAVDKRRQAGGLGGGLMRHIEHDVKAANGRLLLIETSSLPHYEPTRRFYLKHGYETSAVLADYYADGDDMVVFRKRFEPEARPS
ncbi:MAG TPA: GNAT family N-acetyltransferase [Isosphaeraceae bacterium]|jgi:GNAT superfamily N-acetyltransferase|nr:GNAT family N-acetyltransferase [Isosphaeraceae bacterium]